MRLFKTILPGFALAFLPSDPPHALANPGEALAPDQEICVAAQVLHPEHRANDSRQTRDVTTAFMLRITHELRRAGISTTLPSGESRIIPEQDLLGLNPACGNSALYHIDIKYKSTNQINIYNISFKISKNKRTVINRDYSANIISPDTISINDPFDVFLDRDLNDNAVIVSNTIK